MYVGEIGKSLPLKFNLYMSVAFYRNRLFCEFYYSAAGPLDLIKKLLVVFRKTAIQVLL